MNADERAAVLLLGLAMPIFFWVRGIGRGNKSDLMAGAIILAFIAFALIAVARGIVGWEGAFTIAGLFLVIFGIAALLAESIAKPDCPLRRKHRILIGVLLIALGILGMPVIGVVLGKLL